MTSPNTFTDARVGFDGHVSGWDERPHNLFKIERADDRTLYGDYILAFLEDGNHFNVDIGPFGYVDPYHAGDLNPSRRRHFSAEECASAEQLVRSFFPPLASSTISSCRGKTSWAEFAFDRTGSFKSPASANDHLVCANTVRPGFRRNALSELDTMLS